MTDKPLTIAIDGPAASGKSTVGQAVADRLGYLFFDTGAMYRALAWLALDNKLDLADERSLGSLANETAIEIVPRLADCKDDRLYTVTVGGADITPHIRDKAVDGCVSQVAAHPQVREALKRQQRRIGLAGKVVMVGRDIGTAVMPDAPVKIYLDASPEERARRRYLELTRRREEASFDELLASIRERDRYDSARKVAPLRAADDAHLIFSDGLSIPQVVEEILEVVARAGIAPARQQKIEAAPGA